MTYDNLYSIIYIHYRYETCSRIPKQQAVFNHTLPTKNIKVCDVLEVCKQLLTERFIIKIY